MDTRDDLLQGVAPLWHSAAENVLSVMLGDPDAYKDVLAENIRAEHLPPGPWRAAFPAIIDLRHQGREIVGVTLAAATDGAVSVDQAEMWMAKFDILLARTLDDSLQLLRDQSLRARDGQAYADGLARLAASHGRGEVAASVMSHIRGDLDAKIADATAAGLAARLTDMLSEPPLRVLPTNIPFIDRVTYGIQAQQLWWVVSHYKGWKSRLQRNIALNVARNGGKVTMAIFEGTQEMVTTQFAAMLAAEYAINQGWHKATDTDGEPLLNFDPLQILTYRSALRRKWGKQKLEALEYGLDTWASLGDNIRVYDKSKHGGALLDISSVTTLFLRDEHLYGPVDLLCVDYLTRVHADGDSIYSRVESLAHGFQDLAFELATNINIIAQKNEETIRAGRKSRERSVSPGVKGGGDPAATADFLFTTSYDDEMPGYLKITLELARYARHGANVNALVPVEPITGLILPHQTVNLDALEPEPASQPDGDDDDDGLMLVKW